MKYDTIIGIDPGKSGAIAIMLHNINEPRLIKMPNNVKGLHELLISIQDYNPIVYIEKVSVWNSDRDNKGKEFRIQKMLANYTELLTTMKIIGIQYKEVMSRTWIKGLGLESLKDRQERKNRNKRHALHLYPKSNITLWSADAILIMHYGMIMESIPIKKTQKRNKNIQQKLF